METFTCCVASYKTRQNFEEAEADAAYALFGLAQKDLHDYIRTKLEFRITERVSVSDHFAFFKPSLKKYK